MTRIPYNRPFIVGKELYYIAQAVLSGHIAGDGIFTRKCQKFFEETLPAKKVLLTHSCTAALEMAALLLEIGPEDEVIMPSFTFVSTANAFFIRGAKLVFVDIRPDTLNMDEKLLENAITEKTKAIVPVHYAGIGCEMDTIMSIARKHKIHVVEDAAQGVNAKYKDAMLGTFGDFGALSFHETKNFICGEGGAIIINNENFCERAEIIREKGTNRSKFFRGEVDKYTWVDIGSSYLPSEVLSAFLYAQLENVDAITNRRKAIYEYYYKNLKPLEQQGLLQVPHIPPHCDTNFHIFYILVKDEKTRDELMFHLSEDGIKAVFHYLPLHLSPVGRTMGYSDNQLPVTESTSARLLRLPFYYDLKTDEQKAVVGCISDFLKSRI